MKIFLDDCRLSPIGFECVKNIDEFIKLVKNHVDTLEEISFDYDLGKNDARTGLDACIFLVENGIFPPKLIVHSTHPKACEMYSYLVKNMPDSVKIIMEEYDIFKIMEEYK